MKKQMTLSTDRKSASEGEYIEKNGSTMLYMFIQIILLRVSDIWAFHTINKIYQMAVINSPQKSGHSIL